MRRRLLATAIASTALVVAGSLAPTATAAPPEIPGKDLSKQVTGKRVWKHLEAFQEIADENGGNRAAGTPGYEASGAYVESVLRKAGYTTERQYFPADIFTVHDMNVTVPGVELEPIAMTYSGSTPDDGVAAGLVRPAITDGCPASDDPEAPHEDSWAGVDATGLIAVVQRGGCSFSAKSLAAGEAGAAALIVYNNTAGSLNGTLGAVDPGHVPSVGVTQAEGEAIVAALAADPDLTATFDLQATTETVQTFNVLAETRTSTASRRARASTTTPPARPRSSRPPSSSPAPARSTTRCASPGGAPRSSAWSAPRTT